MSQTNHEKVQLTQTNGEHGLRFAGPDLLDYDLIFSITGGEYDGKRSVSEAHIMYAVAPWR